MYCCIIFLQQNCRNLETKKNYKSVPQTLIIISISLQPADLYLWYFKRTLTYVTEYLRSTTLGCKDIGIRKSEFVGAAKTQFLCHLNV